MSERVESLAAASREEIARTIHDELFGGDADELIHHPAANSWDEPTEPRWTQWLECADAILSKLNAPMPRVAYVVMLEGKPVGVFLTASEADFLRYCMRDKGATIALSIMGGSDDPVWSAT